MHSCRLLNPFHLPVLKTEKYSPGNRKANFTTLLKVTT